MGYSSPFKSSEPDILTEVVCPYSNFCFIPSGYLGMNDNKRQGMSVYEIGGM